MPELPEVETVKNVLRKKIINKKIKDVDIIYDNIIKTNLSLFSIQLIGQTVVDINRIGKYLLIELDNYVLISHLRMEGKYFLRSKLTSRNKHDHIVFIFDDDTELRYNDVRKFGTMHLKTYDELYNGRPLDRVGLEPFDDKCNLEYLKKSFKGKRPIKSTLLDQTIITGLGNIYVDEVLYLCKIHPLTASDCLSSEQLVAIKEASILILNKAIECGGTTIRSYYSDDEISGRFQNELLVHGKKGESCMNCLRVIEKIKVGGRGTYYCPNCQKLI